VIRLAGGRLGSWPCGLGGRRGAGRDFAVFRGGLPVSLPGLVRALMSASEQGVYGLRDLLLGWGSAVGGQLLAGVVPRHFPEWNRDRGQVFPEDGDPAAFPVVSDPDPRDVVGVVMDLPQVLPGFDAGLLAAQRVEVLAVVDTVVELDAIGVDRPPGSWQQFDVVLGGECHRDIPGHLDQGGVLLVGGERPARDGRVTEPVVGPLLPAGDDPFIQQFLEFH
jgi:hypothetical protein